MQRFSGVLGAVLTLAVAVPAAEALAQYSPAPAPVYRDAPPAYRVPPSSWMTDDEDDRPIPAPGYGRSLPPGPAYVPQTNQGLFSSNQPGPAPNPQPNFTRDPRDQDAMRPPADISPNAPAAAPQQRAPQTNAALPPEDQPEVGDPKAVDPRFKKQLVNYTGSEPAGTIIIDTSNKFLFLTLGNGKAIRYGIGVGREGFTWAGTERISRMAEWPDWHPPAEMIERQPYLPRFMAGGEGNPLGARALYLGKTLYRIHGTNQPSTIGTNVSSGCIRLVNADIEDLYSRVQAGTRVVVLPNTAPPAASAAPDTPVHFGANTPTGSVSAAPLPAAR